MDAESNAIYSETNGQVEKWSEIIYFTVLKILYPSFMLPRFIVSIFAYFTMDLDSAALQLPFFMSFPFDSHSPIGYLIAFILECIILWHCFCLSLSTINYSIGIYQFAIASTKELKNYLDRIKENAKIKSKQFAMEKNITEFIESQTMAKQLSHDLVP